MRVSVEGGKYTYVITETNAHVLRYGELWKDATGDKFTYSMAAEIESLREQVEKLTAALKLAREALFDMQDSYAAVHGWKDSFVIAATTAIAAIDSLQKGE